MSTALDVDIAALVGEMEAPPCENMTHDPDGVFHDDGPATHYARVQCTACGSPSVIKAYCAAFVAAVLSECLINCPDCHAVLRASFIITILGPVGTTK